MSWMELVARLVEALAWPAAVVVLVIVFRNRLSELLAGLHARLGHLSELKGPGGFAAQFALETREVSATLKTLPSPPPDDPVSDTDVADGPRQTDASTAGSELFRRYEHQTYRQLDQLASVSPRGAVLEAFLILEDDLQRRFMQDYPDEAWERFRARNAPPKNLIEVLERRNQIDSDLAHSLRKLVDLRNEAVHAADETITPETARTYVNSVRTAVERMSQRLGRSHLRSRKSTDRSTPVPGD